jgi:hypothetical protein
MSRIRAFLASLFDSIRSKFRAKSEPDRTQNESISTQNEYVPKTESGAVLANSDKLNYGDYIIDTRTGKKHTPFTLQLLYQPLPAGWDWREWAKVAGVVDPTTHDNRGQKIEEQEARQYVSEAALDMAGFREALLTTPGTARVSSGEAFLLSYAHGAQSRGPVTAVANGVDLGTGPIWKLEAGTYAVSFTGGVRIAVKIRPA